MKYPEKLRASTQPSIFQSQHSNDELNLHIRESQYNIGGVQTYCWLMCVDPCHSAHINSVSLLMYSAPCGLMEIKPRNRETAEELFALFTKYEVSPYHVEDIIEDREIDASIRFL